MKVTPVAKRYYRTLGLSCDASTEEIREAYYQLAFTHHPDRNPGDAHAAARFKEIQNAYEWLSQRWGVPPPPTAEQFPFRIPERSVARSVWQWLGALVAVAAVAVTLTMLLRARPRTGVAVTTESPQLEQRREPSHFAKLHRPVKIVNEKFTTVVNSFTSKSPANNIFQRSAPGKPEWLTESRVGSLLESMGRSPLESFAAALDGVSTEFLSFENLTETWHTSPSWQGTKSRKLPLEPVASIQSVSDSSSGSTLEEDDQQVLIQDGMIRLGNRRREPAALGKISSEWSPPPLQDFDSMEIVHAQQHEGRQWSISPSAPGIAFSAIQPPARQLEQSNSNPDKWTVKPQPLVLQPPQPIGRTFPGSYESGNSGHTLQHLGGNRNSLIPGVLPSTTSPTYRGDSTPDLFNRPEGLNSAVSSNLWKSSPLLPNQPGMNSSRQVDKLPTHWSVHRTQQGLQPTDHAQSNAKADVSTWGGRSTQKASQQSGIASGNAWDNAGIFTQNRVRTVERDFRITGTGGATVNLDWNPHHASATRSNDTGLPTHSEVRMEKTYFLPTTSNSGVSRGPYRDPIAEGGHRRSVPAMTPYDSGFRAAYPGR